MAGPHQLIRTARRVTRLIGQNIHVCISVGDGVVGEGLQPPLLAEICYIHTVFLKEQ